MFSTPLTAQSPLVLVQFVLYLWERITEFGRDPHAQQHSRAFAAEQDHGRTDAPGRKVHTNVEDTKEVVVAARFMFQKVNQLRFIEFGHETQRGRAQKHPSDKATTHNLPITVYLLQKPRR